MLSYPISRLLELARRDGPKEALVRAQKRAAADVALYGREARQRLAGRRLPSEREILQQTGNRWHHLTDLVDHLAHKDSPAFLFSAQDRDRLVAAWQKAFPDSAELTLKQAQQIRRFKFELVGATYDFSGNGSGAGPDWHLDAASGRRWPMDYVERIDRWLWSDRKPGDYRPLWELNRHQYFAVLGKAYWLTGDESYAETCAAHLVSWTRHNPCPYGINWYSPLEIGLRIMAWGLAFHYLRASVRFMAVAGQAFVSSLYQQASYLREHLMVGWPGRNNHLIGEATGLAYAGALLDEFTAAAEWRETGLSIVEEEAARQTAPDGANREQASAYHRFVLDLMTLLIVLSRRGALRPSPQLEAHAVKMLDYLVATLTPAGGLPGLGDSDDGRAFMLGADGNQEPHLETLAAGAVLFERPDYRVAARRFEEGAFWLLGEEGLAVYQAIPALEAAAPAQRTTSFPQGGQYVIRTGAPPKSDYALMRCGEFGLGGEGFCAHAHCDLLSPILWLDGRSVVVDSGTFTYHGPWRDRFRLTAAHNTVLIDGQEQAIPTSPFSWTRVPAARCEECADGRLVGSLTTPTGVAWRRELSWLPSPGLGRLQSGASGAWRLIDRFSGTGTHHLQWAFHLAPDLVPVPRPNAGAMALACRTEPGWVVELEMPGIAFAVEDGWVSDRYGQKTGNKVIRAWWQGDLAQGTRFVWQFSQVNNGTGDEETA